ncbi:MAG: hypothetical protein U1D69_09175, partial [Polynucleobacter sp.]|nr:hypothetical protein [Polynucleobacter sp.]
SNRNNWSNSEKVEGNCKRIDVQNGKFACDVKVYETGAVQAQEADSKLRDALLEAKKAIENEESIGEILPFKIERFPELLKERIPSIDPIIVRFTKEVIATIKAGSKLGCTFLLGGASEKAIFVVIDTYTAAIKEENLCISFQFRTCGKFISRIFDESR